MNFSAEEKERQKREDVDRLKNEAAQQKEEKGGFFSRLFSRK